MNNITLKSLILILISASDYLKDIEEDIYDIKVQIHCRKDIVIDANLMTELPNNELDIKDQINPENNSPKEAKNNLKNPKHKPQILPILPENSNNATDYKPDHSHEKKRSKHSKVSCSSKGVDSKCNSNRSSHKGCNSHCPGIILGGH